MPNAKSYTPGDFSIDEVVLINNKGVEKNITTTYSIIDIQEDLFSTTVHGQIGFTDTEDLRQTFPIVGQEKIRVRFRTHESFPWIEYTFSVYEVANVYQLKEDETAFVLNICSPEFLRNNVSRVDRAFVNVRPEEVAKSVIKNELGSDKEIFVDETSNTVVIVPTQLRPFKAINQLLPRSISKVNPEGAAYVFYETLDGYNYKTIESLYAQTPETYTWGKKTLTTENDKFTMISNYIIQQNYDVLSTTSKGTYGNKVERFNPLTRTVKTTSYNYFDDKDYQKSQKTDNAERVLPETFEYKGIGSRQFVVGDRKNLNVRSAQMNQILDGFKLLMEVPGNSKLRCGQMLKLEIPSMNTKDRTQQRSDKLISGNYLITSLRHVINGGRYFCSVEVCRDNYTTKIEEVTE